MLVKEGVDMAALERLVEEGLIVPEDGVYSLSETGVAEFRRIALENFIEMCIRDRECPPYFFGFRIKQQSAPFYRA